MFLKDISDMKLYIFLLLVITLVGAYQIQQPMDCDDGPCPTGQYFRNGICVPCPEHTFMSMDNNGCKECKPCSTEGHGKVIAEKCTAVKDAKLKCADPNMYLPEQMYATCEQCTRCSPGKEITPCTDYSNAVCETETNTPEQAETTSTEAASSRQFTTTSTPVSVGPDYNSTLLPNTTETNTTKSHDKHGGSSNTLGYIILAVVLIIVVSLIIISVWKRKKIRNWLCKERVTTTVPESDTFLQTRQINTSTV